MAKGGGKQEHRVPIVWNEAGVGRPGRGLIMVLPDFSIWPGLRGQVWSPSSCLALLVLFTVNRTHRQAQWVSTLAVLQNHWGAYIMYTGPGPGLLIQLQLVWGLGLAICIS